MFRAQGLAGEIPIVVNVVAPTPNLGIQATIVMVTCLRPLLRDFEALGTLRVTMVVQS